MNFLDSLVCWIAIQEDLKEDFKNSLLSKIDLNNFSTEELVDRVRKLQLFDWGTIFDIVSERVVSKRVEKEKKFKDKVAADKARELNLELARKNVCLSTNGGSIYQGCNDGKSCISDPPNKTSDDGSTRAWKTPDERLIVKLRDEFELNKIEFLLNSGHGPKTYIVESKCAAGEAWSTVVDCSQKECSGLQTITFKAKK